MLLQAALNGGLAKDDHPAVPASPEELAQDAVACVQEIHAVVNGAGLTAPRLQHGDGEATWEVLADAVRRGLDTRVGLEDTLHEPGGELTTGNEGLVRTARELGAYTTTAR